MKNITKLVLVLFTSSLLSLNAFAGELTVTGTAKVSYSMGGADKDASKGIGISNEIGLGASGELDNGYTWNYALALDPNAGGTIDNDDQTLTLTTPYGTIGAFVSAGGLSTELSYGIGANGVGHDYSSPMTFYYGSDVSDYSNVQYHTPAGMLPFGISAKIGYVPNMSNTADSQDFKSAGAVEGLANNGADATMVQLTASPIDGLSVGGDYFQTDGGAYKQTPTAGNVFAKYTYGPVTVGIHRGQYDVGLTAKKDAVTKYENASMGIQFAVNDQLSISYQVEKSEAFTTAAIAAGATSTVKTGVESELKSIQAAYNIGGATVGVTRTEVSKSDYSDPNDEAITLLTLAMAF